MLHKNKKHGFFLRTLLALVLVISSISPSFATPYGDNSPKGILRDYLIPDASNNRVGIGTSTPSTRFDVFGTSGNANTQFVIDSSGNVGIGTASPQEKIHVEDGNVQVTPVNPRHVAAVFDEASISLNGANNIQVSGDYAFVTSYNESAFVVIDISNPESPFHVAEKIDNPILAMGRPTMSLISGDYAFVTSADTNGSGGEVQVLNISDLGNIMGTDNIEASVIPGMEWPIDMALLGKYLFVIGNTGGALIIIDISNPQDVVVEGEYGLLYNGPSAIDISGSHAYVASTDDNDVEIIDISNPADPQHEGAISTVFAGPKDILVSGRYAYVASGNGIEIIDISNPTAPLSEGSLADTVDRTLNGASALALAGDYLYVAATDDNGIGVVDVSDPSSPQYVGSIVDDSETVLSQPTDIIIVGKYAYVTAGDPAESGLQVLDISGIESSTATIGSLRTDTFFVNGNADASSHLYVHGAVNVGSMEAQPFVCGTDTIQDADGNTYDTVEIGSQCWMAENLNVGTYVASVITGEDHADVSDNGIIEKHCFNNIQSNCDIYGGLYTWDEAMGYSTTEGAQGICPAGWHIPTDAEQNALDQYLTTGTCNPSRDGFWDCDPAGTALKEGGSSEFNAPLAGSRHASGEFYNLGPYTSLWSSSESGGDAWRRYLNSSFSEVFRHARNKLYGLSVRCINDLGSVQMQGIGIQSDGPLSVGPGNSFFGGNLLINTLDDSRENVVVNINGNINTVSGGYRDNTSCIWGICISDARLKTDIVSLSDSLQKLLQLNPVTFYFLDEQYGKGLQTGLIAQEVEQVFPDWVINRDNGYKAIRYGTQLQMHIIEALQELKTQTNAELQSLRAEQDSLQSDILSLQNQ